MRVGPQDVEHFGNEEFQLLGVSAVGDRVRLKQACISHIKADHDTWFTGLVVLSQDKIIVVDRNACKVRLHSLQDGRLLAVHRTESDPWDICVCNEDETKMAVCLLSGQIEILSVKSTNKTTEITRMETLNVRTGFDGCSGVKYFNKKLVVSGWKEDSLCWGVVSITDGHKETFHKICKYGEYVGSYLCTNNNDMVCVSCWAGDENPDVTGVYGYRNFRREFLYQHKDLNFPRGVTMDRRHVYVCNKYPPCIHEMTESGQPLTIHTQGIQPSSYLIAIHWNQQDGLLYVTSYDSNVITRFRPEYSDHQDPFIPAEVLKMDTRSLDMYKEALKGGKEKVYNITIMIVGQFGVGKTTLTKRLLGKDVNISERKSTEGIDVNIECSKVSLSSGEWTAQEKSSEQDYRLQRLAKVLNEKQSLRDRAADEMFVNSPQGEKTPDSTAGITDEEHVISPQGKGVIDTNDEAHVAVEDKDTEIIYHRSPHQGIGQNLSSTASHQEFPSAVGQRKRNQSDTFTVARSQPTENTISGSQKMDPMAELIQLLQDNADKLKQDESKNSLVSVWDFAGQYSFYTTHQTFLNRRAIYLLVSDVSGHITDLVDDDCYFDSEGMKKCRVCAKRLQCPYLKSNKSQNPVNSNTALHEIIQSMIGTTNSFKSHGTHNQTCTSLQCSIERLEQEHTALKSKSLHSVQMDKPGANKVCLETQTIQSTDMSKDKSTRDCQ
ncbi:hypothetical protein CHS0354_011694 [Potamilus streckersoni]|uniref:Uncharacterized protein n=1 Tax=Potamilus streckersoni TaxID=2493646 RepID=A0AAE0RRU7_9BIVA|nr:hypothetical protein CHS0354_011694 [Potamilus streckersoni]